VGNFLLEYGLFAAKTLTIIVGILTIIAFSFAIINFKRKHKEENYIEIENINHKLENLQESLELEILSKSDFKKLLKSRKKEKKLKEKNKSKASANSNNESEETENPKIFLLKFSGDLHASHTDNLREEITAILSVAKQNDQVLLKLESNGGIVHNYGLAAAQLQRIKQNNIRLVVSIDLIAASGGYMMACVADKIIAAPFAIVGSIGVLAQVPNFNKLLQKHNIDIEHHTSGEYKTTLTMLGKNTEKGRQKFITELEDTHKLFKEFLKYNRTNLNIDQVATGEYWYGLQALDLNLIDEIRTSDDYLLERKSSHDIYSIEYKVHVSLRDQITNILSQVVYNTTNMVIQKLTNKTKAPIT
jgi:serine protease SohB